MLSVIRPHTMNRLPAERLPIDEATRVGGVRWIILDDFSMQHGEKDFIKRKLISRCFFISMIADADPIGAYCLDYIVNIDVRLSLSVLKRLRPNARLQAPLIAAARNERRLSAVACRVEPVVTHPAPPQTRTCAIHASGSSA